MDRLVHWLSKHIDQKLSLIGVAFILVMTLSGIAGPIFFSAGNTFFAAVFITIFFVFFTLLFVTALRTDTALKLTTQERVHIWRKAPKFVKISVGVLLIGHVLNITIEFLLPADSLGLPLFFAAFAISLVIFARGMQTEKPPIARLRQEPLSFESSPAQYMQHARPRVFSLYLVATIFLLMALSPLWT